MGRDIRRSIVCLLLAIAPMGSVRVVCIDEPTGPPAAAASTADGCVTSCAMRGSPGSDAACAWNEGSPRLLLVATDGFPPRDVPVLVPWRAVPESLDAPSTYDDPFCGSLSPPPRA